MLVLRAIVLGVAMVALTSPADAMVGDDRNDTDVPIPMPRLVGYALPVAEPLVLEPWLLPGAPRAYRGGVHEGIDFSAPYGMPVHAARAGVIVRIDTDYVEWSVQERAVALAAAALAGWTPPDVLDRLRGRQVWIDHGDSVVTRYAHLSKVAALHVGDRVAAGDLVGNVGASGFPEGGPHLHFEIRVGDGYLGEDLSPEEVRYVVARAFTPYVGFAVRGF